LVLTVQRHDLGCNRQGTCHFDRFSIQKRVFKELKAHAFRATGAVRG
jgi:hypothetical protein